MFLNARENVISSPPEWPHVVRGVWSFGGVYLVRTLGTSHRRGPSFDDVSYLRRSSNDRPSSRQVFTRPRATAAPVTRACPGRRRASGRSGISSGARARTSRGRCSRRTGTECRPRRWELRPGRRAPRATPSPLPPRASWTSTPRGGCCSAGACAGSWTRARHRPSCSSPGTTPSAVPWRSSRVTASFPRPSWTRETSSSTGTHALASHDEIALPARRRVRDEKSAEFSFFPVEVFFLPPSLAPRRRAPRPSLISCPLPRLRFLFLPGHSARLLGRHRPEPRAFVVRRAVAPRVAHGGARRRRRGIPRRAAEQSANLPGREARLPRPRRRRHHARRREPRVLPQTLSRKPLDRENWRIGERRAPRKARGRGENLPGRKARRAVRFRVADDAASVPRASGRRLGGAPPARTRGDRRAPAAAHDRAARATGRRGPPAEARGRKRGAPGERNGASRSGGLRTQDVDSLEAEELVVPSRRISKPRRRSRRRRSGP